MSTVVIAGAAGFIGSHLADYHIGAGDTVVGIDNLATGSRSNVEHLLGHENFQLLTADVAGALPELPDSAKYVYHLASPASPPQYHRLAIPTMMANSTGTQHLLDYAARSGSRFLFASTSETYGDPLVHPQPETYWGNVNPVGPRSVYDEAKRFGEALVAQYQRDGSDVVIVRIFNTYGPRMDPWDGRVVSTFVRQALAGEVLTVFGNGNQTRSFCFISDMVKGLVAAMESTQSGPINLGNPQEFTLRELADCVGQVVGMDVELDFGPLPQDDPQRRQPDIGLAMAALGWKPEVPLDQGLRLTVEWMREHLQR